jgi:hypothetical protein
MLTRATFFLPKDAKKLTFGGAFYSFFETRRRFVTQKTNGLPPCGRRLKTSKSEEEKRKNLI